MPLASRRLRHVPTGSQVIFLQRKTCEILLLTLSFSLKYFKSFRLMAARIYAVDRSISSDISVFYEFFQNE